MTVAAIPGPPIRNTIGAAGRALVDLSRRKATLRLRPDGADRASGTLIFPSSTRCVWPSYVRREYGSNAISRGVPCARPEGAETQRTAIISATRAKNRFDTLFR